MAFNQCPECGETNHEEDDYRIRTFECGFMSHDDTRTALCRSKARKGSARTRPSSNGEDSRYRLALLDAAQVADILANDMASEGAGAGHVERCRELSRQMRAFAGHTSTGTNTFDDFSKPDRSTSRVLAIIRRVKPW